MMSATAYKYLCASNCRSLLVLALEASPGSVRSYQTPLALHFIPLAIQIFPGISSRSALVVLESLAPLGVLGPFSSFTARPEINRNHRQLLFCRFHHIESGASGKKKQKLSAVEFHIPAFTIITQPKTRSDHQKFNLARLKEFRFS